VQFNANWAKQLTAGTLLFYLILYYIILLLSYHFSSYLPSLPFTKNIAYGKDAWDAVYDKSKTNARVLDIACGTGVLALPVAEVFFYFTYLYIF
jgi:hypothetical protein